MDLKFCRRCGSGLTTLDSISFQCESGHSIYSNPSPATAAIILNAEKEILVGERSLDPHKGMLDIPGGFVDGKETCEAALARELFEETGLEPTDYTDPIYFLSCIDDYEYEGEIVTVLTVVYAVGILGEPDIEAQTDMASLYFSDTLKLKSEDFCFRSAQESLSKLKQILSL